MGQAAGLLKTDKRILQEAARKGAPGFLSSGRVDVEMVRGYLEANPQPKADLPPPPSPEEMEELRTMESSLQAAVDEEIAAQRALAAARKAGTVADLPALSQSYAIARRGRMLAEKMVREERTRAGELLPVAVHKIQLGRLYHPFVSAMRTVPRTLALHFPNNVELDALLTREIEGVLKAGQVAIQKEINGEIDGDFHLRACLGSVLNGPDVDVPKALARLDELTAEIRGHLVALSSAGSNPVG